MVDYYDNILQTVTSPELVYLGKEVEFLVLRSLQSNDTKKIAVVYRELSNTDGFIITAYLTRKIREFEKRILI